ncbi:MAG: hypothetical protein U1B30_17210 [Pseudomonadota bacterium]|nr:hypothetical protein [Pseudomonadota bacterium]
MNHSSKADRDPGHSNTTSTSKNIISSIKSLQPGTVALMFLIAAMFAYMVWVFFGGYLQSY